MQGLDSDYPRLPPDATPKDCVRWLRALMYWAGPCFHPEDPPSEYVIEDEFGNCGPSFSPALCELMDSDMGRCYAMLTHLGKDPCSIALKVQRLLQNPPQRKQTS